MTAPLTFHPRSLGAALAFASAIALGAAPAHAATKPAAAPKTAPKPAPSPATYGPVPGGLPKPKPKAAPTLPTPTITVRDLAVRGNARISDDRILLSIPISPGDKVTQADVLDAIQRIYGMGYFQDVKAGTEPMVGGQRLVFTVVENPTLGGVTFSGNTKVSTDKLTALFKPMVGDIINYNDVKGAVDKLEKLYSDAGYPLARVADMKLEPGGVLHLTIAEGRIAAIKITGNKETKDYVIRRELSTKPGEIFSAAKIRDDLRRIYNLNYFSAVNLKFEPAPNNEVTVVIDVKEKQTGSINVGAGYSTQEGILGMASVKKDNLFGTGQQVGLDLSVSQYYQITGALTYYNPWIAPNRTGLGGSLYVRSFNNFLANFREDSTGLELNASKPLFGDPITTPWRGTLGGRIEHVVTFDNVLFGGNQKTMDSLTGRPITLNQTQSQNANVFNFGIGDALAGVSGGLSYDTRDIVTNPTSGTFDTLTVEPNLINGSVPMLKTTGSASKFWPFPSLPWAPGQATVVALNGNLGLIEGPQVPEYERFFSTGQYLIRGWPEYVDLSLPGSIGTKYPVNFFQGSNVVTASLEYRFPIYSILSGVVFGDTGLFWDQGTFDLHNLHSGYGLGVRVNTPLGPLRLDYGMSGLEPGTWHFSIGQKF